jgi:hypothetical protein
MNADKLHVVAARANPLRWKTPDRIYKDWVEHMLDSGVKLTVVECQYGEREFTAALPHVNHIGVRATTWCWSKENLLNIGISRIPEARYICWSDSDIFHRRADWAVETLHALQNYHVVQPWAEAYDLGPDAGIMQTHVSFAKVFHQGGPVVPSGGKFWKYDGGVYQYPHSGYVWAATRQAIDGLGGLLEVGGMGSGDHHMALALAGLAERSMPGKTSEAYRRHVMRWQDRALRHINSNVGYVPASIEHRFHGKKADRGYCSRWDMFMEHQFDPDEDLKKNADGVFEWAGNKPDLRRQFDLYLRSRNEDATTS